MSLSLSRLEEFELIKKKLIFHATRILKLGFFLLIKKSASKILRFVIGFLILPISVPLHIFGYRRLNVFASRIGHLAIEPDLIIKAVHLKLIPRRRYFIAVRCEIVANSYLLGYWKKYFRIICNPYKCFFVDCLTAWGLCKQDTRFLINEVGKTQAAYKIYSEWGNRGSLLKVLPEENSWFEQEKLKIGLPVDSWFVCIHAREGGFSPVDESIQNYRNSSIDNLIPAIKEIVRRGGWVVRMGDPTTQLLSNLENTIDYAHSHLRSERMDVLLCANARFILGNTSGLALVGSVFGVPCALANMVPMSTLGLNHCDISIPKIHFNLIDNKPISFKEIMNSAVSNFRDSHLYKFNGIGLRENSSDEILMLAVQMLDSLSGVSSKRCNGFIYNALSSYFLNMFREGHYSYGSNAGVCEDFFIKHKNLLLN